MSPEGIKRKLAAVLHADVKSYSRLMGENEEETLRTLNIYLKIIFKYIGEFRGRVVGTAGDAVLAEFPSAVDSVNCAVEIQRDLAERNAGLPDDRKMLFRIGVNLGDVMEDGDQIYGDGVNIAARVEALADGGGVSISGSTYDQVHNKLALDFNYIGEHSVKNIANPVRIYRVLTHPGDAAHRVVEAKSKVERTWKKKALALTVFLALGLVAVLTWDYYYSTSEPAKKVTSREQTTQAPSEAVSSPAAKEKLPAQPSIAVLPFDNMSRDADQEYLSDGISESIIMGLSSVPQLFVIARNSTFVYKNKPVKVQQVARDLGVRYVLEGSVQRSGDRLRITAQLIDALNGRHVWAERYDREMKDLFAMQDEITIRVIYGMRLMLTEGEQVRTNRYPRHIETALKQFRVMKSLERFSPEGNARVRKTAEEMIALEPDWPGGYYLLALANLEDFHLGTSKSPMQTLDRAIALSEKAISLNDSVSQFHALLGHLYATKRDYDKAVAIGEKAIALNPNGADAHVWLGMSLTYALRGEEAIPHFIKALRLNPYAPMWYYLALGHSYRVSGHYEKAEVQYKKSLAISPDSLPTYVGLCSTYIEMGKADEARAAAAEVMRINPMFSLDQFSMRIPFKDLKFRRRTIENLRQAGLE